MSSYIAPALRRTGGCGMQPAPADTETDWYFDAAFNYAETGFLDAPDYLPTGSVRGMDCHGLVLGLAHERRAS